VKRIVIAAGVVALGMLVLVGVAVAEKPTVVKVGNLVLTIDGGVKPKALPRKTMAPIELDVAGKIATADGTHAPALQEVIVDTDKNGTVDARGVPTCKAGQLEARTTSEAEKICKAAIVGTGTTNVEIQFPEQRPIPIQSKLLALNGGVKGGKTTIYIHAFLTDPVAAALVTTVVISKEKNGRYGTRSIATIPRIANGQGSVTAFTLKFQKRLFPYKGKQHGYLLAKCADGHFDAQAEAVFIGADRLGGKIVRACTPKG
jgi:hypothetical protein